MNFVVNLKKELLLLSRDIHALGLLFVMPMLFILIMSLAMQDTFSDQSTVRIDYLLVNEDQGEASFWLSEQLQESGHFKPSTVAGSLEELRAIVQNDGAKFLVTIPAGFTESLSTAPILLKPLTLEVSPGTRKPTLLLFDTKLKELVGRLYINTVTKSLGAAPGGFSVDSLKTAVRIESAEGADQALPTSVQQNVPAWLVFSMFFIAIPVSTTFLAERSQGTLYRLVTMGVSRRAFLLAKLVTYMFINLIQVVLMFAVGYWLVPLLGGDALTMGRSPAGLLLVSIAISFAAVAFALVISNIAATTEQATVMAGASNIILAAIGGVMVPRFIMPPVMQKFSLLSPHSWGLEGFLDIVLRNGAVVDVLPECGLLLLFGAVMLVIAAALMKRRQ